MEGFQVTEIGEKIYCILDAGNSSFYVVEGEEKAAVIDTGITAGAKILPVIRELTDKPLLLVITHAHPDHMYHIDEFDEVYMCHEEKKMDPETLVMLTAGKLKPWEEIHDIRTDSVIPLGGTELAVCQTPGHTPGSVVYKTNGALFTGDTLFAGSCGRVDFPGGSWSDMCRSLRRLDALEGEYQVYPGHEMPSTLSRERAGNSFMRSARQLGQL